MGGIRDRLAPAPASFPAPCEARPAPHGQIDARQLIATANGLLALASNLERLAQRGEDGSIPMDPATVLAMAREEYRRRRHRSRFFDEQSLFGEPAWDMLLDLFIAGLEGKRVPVTSACIGACVPTTTALRWLALLEERDLIVREPDPTDARRAHVRLSPRGMERMEHYFQHGTPAAGRQDPRS